MKVIIQVPCFNEEHQLEKTVNCIRSALLIKDSKIINNSINWEILIINDGSNDNTLEVAKKLNVDHVISHKKNRGLAATYRTGIKASLELGADIIVNTDADNQYNPQDIYKQVLKKSSDPYHF